MRKSSRKSAKVFQEKDATLIAEKVCALKQFVGGCGKRGERRYEYIKLLSSYKSRRE